MKEDRAVCFWEEKEGDCEGGAEDGYQTVVPTPVEMLLSSVTLSI